MSTHEFKYIINNFAYIKNNFSLDEINNYSIQKLNCNFNIYKLKIGQKILIIKFSLNQSICDGDNNIQNYNNEYEVFKELKDPNYVIKIYDFFKTSKYTYYLQEFLYPILDINNHIELFKKILISINEFHQNNLVHLDIHRFNILFDSGKNVKLIDLELSKKIGTYISFENSFGNIYKYPKKFISTGIVDIYIDIWSIGVLFYDLIYNRCPFSNYQDYEQKKITYIDKTCEYNKLIFYILENYEKINCCDIIEYINKNYEVN